MDLNIWNILLRFNLLLISSIALYYTFPYIIGSPKSCDLTNVSRCDFYNYYGLINIDNPLLHNNAEQGQTINSKCELFYDHMHLFPSGNIPLSKSIIIQALRGSGKTQIRQCVIQRLPQKNHILIKIYGGDINNYLDNFVKSIDITNELPHENIRKYWTKEHFLQVILTEMASRFVNIKYLSILKEKRNRIPLQTRKEVATLLSFYSTNDPHVLCQMINLLLHEITECSLSDCNVPCYDTQSHYGDHDMSIALAERHKKIKVRRQTTVTDASTKVLLVMHIKTKYSPLPCLDRSYRDQLTILVNFFRTLNISTTVIVDSLNENALFSSKDDTNSSTLQTFVDSMTNDEILQLALGNWGEGDEMLNSFSFYMFIPKTENTSLNISWTRPDKISVIDLKWNELQLINYVDYIFDYLRTKSHDECKGLPDICSLLGGQKLCLDTMKQLRHPRDFNIFFSGLARHMSTVSRQRNRPFITNSEDLESVFKETKSQRLKE